MIIRGESMGALEPMLTIKKSSGEHVGAYTSHTAVMGVVSLSLGYHPKHKGD